MIRNIDDFRRKVTDKYVTEVMINLQKEEESKKDKDLFLKTHKKCNICNEYKPLDEFYYNPMKYKKRSDYCKDCGRKRQKEYRLKQKNLKKI